MIQVTYDEYKQYYMKHDTWSLFLEEKKVINMHGYKDQLSDMITTTLRGNQILLDK